MSVKIHKPSIPDEFLVDNRVYTDQGLFQQERQRIFLRVWNLVCHQSEISAPGDYISAVAAGQPIIVCRNGDGAIKAFYNTCRHRAAEVVPRGCGNAKVFTCMYHLWTYDLDGRLTGVPGKEAYNTIYNPDGLSAGDFGLISVRAATAHGLVFVCFDEEAPELDDFLAETADVLREPFGSPDLVVRSVRSETVEANWKMQPENSRDGYHAPLLHKRLRHVSPPRPYKILSNGHAVQFLDLDYERGLKHDTLDQELARNPDLTKSFMEYPLPGMTRENPSYVITLFPDTLILVRFSTLMIQRQTSLDPGKTLIELKAGGLIGDTPSVQEVRERHWDLYWSDQSGNIPEDWAAYEAQQRGVESIGVRYSLMARGEPADEGLRGDDNRLRSFWTAWRDHMGMDRNAPPGANS